MSIQCDEIITRLRALENRHNVEGMARFGINPAHALGISVNTLREIAKEIKAPQPDSTRISPAERHTLAAELWDSHIHEARILASIIDDPKLVTEAQMEAWAAEFDSWDLVDQCCGNLFDKTPPGYTKALEWSDREEEFVRRAAFSLIAYIAVHDKKRPDADFEPLLAAIQRRATDERNFVKKAVNWALRSIGKRNRALNTRALQVARQMETLESRAARWNAKDTIRELTSETVQERLK